MYFPFTFDSYDPDYNGSDDVFLTVLDPDLTWPVSSTFVGGSLHEILGCILIDPDNNVYLSGSTNSSNFPIITSSYDPDFNGAGGAWDGEDIGGDIYVTMMPRTFYVDSDGDSRLDAGDNCPQTPNPDQSDADSDGAGDVCDECTDTDGDGYGDPGYPANTCSPDNCPNEYNADQADPDQDGVGTLCDNCPGVYNPDQLDSDHDNTGDACETCCVGRTGDVNGEGGDEPTIGDISTLIDALFISGSADPLSCLTEADINQSGGPDPVFDDITIGDISILIDYLFITGASLGLPACL
jgi:hypothetical protein